MQNIRKDVLEIAVTFKREMNKIGKGYSFVKTRDITKTYHYRYFSSFLDKCYKNDFTFDECKEIIKELIAYAKENGLLHKGVSLISRSDIIEICIKRIEKEIREIEISVDMLKENIMELNKIDDLTSYLCKKKNRHGSVNMVILRNNGKLTDSIISISKSCMRAYLNLDKSDKIDMPTLKEYVLLKNKIVNKIGRESISEIMGDDFNG